MEDKYVTRSFRRAAERQTTKLAAKTSKAQFIAVPATKAMSASAYANDQPLSTLDFNEPSDPAEQPANYQMSDARLAANRANAQLSTGPTRAEGKANPPSTPSKPVSLAAPSSSPPTTPKPTSKHVARHSARLAPAPIRNISRPIHCRYRMASRSHRPARSQFYALGRRELAHTVADEPDPINREALLIDNIFVIYRVTSIISPSRSAVFAASTRPISEKLQALQNERVEKEKSAAQKLYNEMQRALEISNNARKHRLPFNPGDRIFLDEFLYYCDQTDTHHKLTGCYPNVEKALAAYRAAQGGLSAQS